MTAKEVLLRELCVMEHSEFRKLLGFEQVQIDKQLRRANGEELTRLQGRAQEIERLVDMIDGARTQLENLQTEAVQRQTARKMF